jgi:glutathionylspermidine synthase
MSKTITITVSPNGKTTVEANGFTGQSCKDATKFLETVLGRKTEQQYKPEFFATNNHSHQMEVRQ